jgi:hypothetical protein
VRRAVYDDHRRPKTLAGRKKRVCSFRKAFQRSNLSLLCANQEKLPEGTGVDGYDAEELVTAVRQLLR